MKKKGIPFTHYLPWMMLLTLLWIGAVLTFSKQQKSCLLSGRHHYRFLSYAQRIDYTSHPVTKKLFQLMEDKKTNLCFSADLSDKKEFLSVVDLVGPEICLLKTHYDIIQDFDDELVKSLQNLAHKHQFLIFEDRKFADIGTTVKLQFKSIAQWANIVNAHIIAGQGTIEGLKDIGLKKGNGLLLIAQMSSIGNLLNKTYEQCAITLAETYNDFVIGFIAQQRLENNPGFIYLTPGIRLEKSSGILGQQYTTPLEAIVDRGSDIIIVGSGIYKSDNPLKVAQAYRTVGWQAYQERLKE